MRQQSFKAWTLDVLLPTGALVSHMEELSAWGPAMGIAFVCCVCTSLSLVPTAIAMESTPMFVALTAYFFAPLRIAYTPAKVS